MFGSPGSKAGRKRTKALAFPITILQGGTGQTTRQPAFNALAPASPAQGDIIYFDGSNWVRLPAGTSGNFLTTGGPAANPSWTPDLEPWTLILNTADETRTTNTTFADSANMAGFAVAANTRYVWRSTLIFGDTGAGGSKIQYTGPASPTIIEISDDLTDSNNATVTTVVATFATVLSVTNAPHGFHSTVGFLNNGANAGTVKLQWAQNSSSGSSILHQGSYLEWMQV